MISSDEIARRKAIATDARQIFEEAYRIARQRTRPADYEAALLASISYVNSATALIAYLLRDTHNEK